MVLDEMPVNDVIQIYTEKHDAMHQGDMVKLLELKNKYPCLFDKEKDAQIYNMIRYAEAFQGSERYRELKRIEMKEKLFII